jgi:hypothetical protein
MAPLVRGPPPIRALAGANAARANPAELCAGLKNHRTIDLAKRLGMTEALPEYAHLQCAIFASAILRRAGLLPTDLHGLIYPRWGNPDRSSSLEAALIDRGWTSVGLDAAQMGDVVIYSPLPPADHVDFFVGWNEHGFETIGSSNVDGLDAPQWVAPQQRDYATYAPIVTVYRAP